MKEITKEKYRKGLIGFGNESFKSPLYGEIGIGVKEAVSEALKNGDVEGASSNYQKYADRKIIPFVDEAFKETIDEISLDEPIDIIDNEQIENTLFMKPIDSNATDIEEDVDNKEDAFDKSFILDFNKFNDEKLNQEEPSNIVESAPLNETEVEETEEVKEETKQKKLTKGKKGNRAAYVDTVILCLVAQLTIFGLLIVILLMIK